MQQRSCCETKRFAAGALSLQAVFVAPFAHTVENGDKGATAFRERIFDFRRDLWIFFAVHELVGFQLFEGGAEGFVGDIADIAFHFVEANNAELHQRVEDGHFVFAVDERQRVVKSCRFQ